MRMLCLKHGFLVISEWKKIISQNFLSPPVYILSTRTCSSWKSPNLIFTINALPQWSILQLPSQTAMPANFHLAWEIIRLSKLPTCENGAKPYLMPKGYMESNIVTAHVALLLLIRTYFFVSSLQRPRASKDHYGGSAGAASCWHQTSPTEDVLSFDAAARCPGAGSPLHSYALLSLCVGRTSVNSLCPLSRGSGRLKVTRLWLLVWPSGFDCLPGQIRGLGHYWSLVFTVRITTLVMGLLRVFWFLLYVLGGVWSLGLLLTWSVEGVRMVSWDRVFSSALIIVESLLKGSMGVFLDGPGWHDLIEKVVDWTPCRGVVWVYQPLALIVLWG